MLCITCGQREATIICEGGPNKLFCSQECIDRLNAAAKEVQLEFEERAKQMAKPYYLCAYGHVVRCSERVSGPAEAMKQTYGLESDRITALEIRGTAWKYLTQKVKDGHIARIKQLHKQKTGNDITSF